MYWIYLRIVSMAANYFQLDFVYNTTSFFLSSHDMLSLCQILSRSLQRFRHEKVTKRRSNSRIYNISIDVDLDWKRTRYPLGPFLKELRSTRWFQVARRHSSITAKIWQPPERNGKGNCWDYFGTSYWHCRLLSPFLQGEKSLTHI